MRPYHLNRTVPASAGGQYGTVAAGPNGAPKPSPEAVRAQLAKILASRAFAGAERPGRFLRFIVEQALAGNQLKETLLGVEVFGQSPSYDPRLDGVARVEAVKLRSRLKEYYETEGAADPVRIDLPKGGYLPCFDAVPGRPVEPIGKVAAAPCLVDGLAGDCSASGAGCADRRLPPGPEIASAARNSGFVIHCRASL
jgi:hypothetical protein